MPFETKMTAEQAIEKLNDLTGTEDYRQVNYKY